METYVSIDVETDGPIPGPHSMLSLGAAAFDHHGRHFSSFEGNLETLPGAGIHPDTLAFWNQHKSAYKATRKDVRLPALIMVDFHKWLDDLPHRPVFVGYPITFDFMFVYWYLMHFIGSCPASFSGIDIKTLAQDRLKKPYRDISKRIMPESWFEVDETKKVLSLHHNALQDAIKQGHLYFKVRSAR